MRITELLQDVTIDLGVKVNSKEEAIDHLVDLMVKGGNITDREEYKKGILAREANGTTGIGGGIAIPHSKNKAVTKAGLASMTVPDGVDYEAMDGEPSDVFFMIAKSVKKRKPPKTGRAILNRCIPLQDKTFGFHKR